VCAADVAVVQDPAWPTDALEVGRIVDAWGVKGWLKVQPFSSDPQALLAAPRWFVKPPDDASQTARPRGLDASRFPTSLAIAEARQHGDFIVAMSPAVIDRNAAEALRGARLFVSRASFPASAEDEFYWVDLIGLAVVNREGLALGTVIGLLDTGPHSVLRVQPDGVQGAEQAVEERLIPFVAAYVDTVDLAGHRITVDWGADF
jgi:16S rRNA processing protein RimM